MLVVIYGIVWFLIVILATVDLAFILVTRKKGEYSVVKNIKLRIVISVVVCLLFIVQTILSIVLEDFDFTFILMNIFFTLVWALDFASDISNYKVAKLISAPCFDYKNEETEKNDTDNK